MKEQNINKELYHLCYCKDTLFILLSVRESIWTKTSYIVTANLSLIENCSGTACWATPIGMADNIDDALQACIDKLNKVVEENRSRNEELLCCKNISKLYKADFLPFEITREFSVSIMDTKRSDTGISIGDSSFVQIYVKKTDNKLKYVSSISQKVCYAATEQEIIDTILKKIQIGKKYPKISNRLKEKNQFYPSFENFTR